MDSTVTEGGSSGAVGSGASQYVMMTSSGPPGPFGVGLSPTSSSSTSSPTSSSSSSSSSSQAQYLNPDYVQPLTTCLDAKNSPLALLAQTCSSIGRDSNGTPSAVAKGNHPSTSSVPMSMNGGHHNRDGASQLSVSSSVRTKCSMSPLVAGKTVSQQLHKSGPNCGGDRKTSNGTSVRPTGSSNGGEQSSSASPPSRSKVGSGSGFSSSARTRNSSGHRTGSSSSAGSGGGKSDGVESPSPTTNNAGSASFGVKSSSGSGPPPPSSRQDTSGHQLRYNLNDEYHQYYNNNNTHGNNLFPAGSEFSSASFDKFLLPSLDGQSGTTLQQLHLQHQAARYQNEALALQAAIQAALYSSSPLAALYGSAPGGPSTASNGSGPGLGGVPTGADSASMHAAAVYSAGLQAAAAAAAASGLYPPVPRSDLFCTAGSSSSTGSPCTIPGCGCANVGVDAMSQLRYSTSASSMFQPPSSALMGGLLGGPSSGGYSCSWLQQSNGEFCGRRFSTSGELLDHLRTHAASAQSTAASQTSPGDSRRGQRSPRASSPSASSSAFHGHRPLVVPSLLPPLPPPPGLGFPSNGGYPPSASALFDRLTTGSGRAPSPSSLFHSTRSHAVHQNGTTSAGSRRDELSPSSLLFQAVSSASSSSLSRYHPYRFSQSSSSSSPVISGGVGSGLLPVDPVSPGSFLPGGVVPPPPIPSSLMAAYLSSPYAATLYNAQRLGPAVGP